MEIADLFGVSAKAVFGYQKQGDFNFFIDAMVVVLLVFYSSLYGNLWIQKVGNITICRCQRSDLTVNNLKLLLLYSDQNPMTSLSGVNITQKKENFQ
jgi:hypothetical protein